MINFGVFLCTLKPKHGALTGILLAARMHAIVTELWKGVLSGLLPPTTNCCPHWLKLAPWGNGLELPPIAKLPHF
jgi:hypothetical protein